MRLGIVAVFWLFAIASPGIGQTLAPGRQPYSVHVVALLSEHRAVATELFREQFPRDVAQRTERALGDLVKVDAALSHPLAETIRREGLDAAVEGFEDVSPRRTWFLLVTYHEGQFRIQGRFFDGLSGLPGPRSRTLLTSDRSRLAHLAAQLIAEPFPLVGTIVRVKDDRVELAIHGGQLADAPTVGRGTVFALSRISPEAGQWRARRVPWAALEARSASMAGVSSCQLWHRFREDNLSPAEKVVYRALMVPTLSAPLKMQVIDQETSQPLAGLTVRVEGGVPRPIDLTTDAAGVAATPGNVAHLALVKVSQGTTVIAQFPAPIVDDRPLVCAVSARPEAEDLTSLDIRRQQLFVRMLGTRQVIDQRLGVQRVLLGQSLEKALEHAYATLVFLDREIADIRHEREEIRHLAGKRATSKVAPEEGEKGLARLTQLRAQVSESTERIAESIAQRNEQTEKQKIAVKLVEQGTILESQAQFDEAIAHFEKASVLVPEWEKLQERLKSLRKSWAIQSEDHRQARRYIVETWPKVEVSALKEQLGVVEKALEACRDADDRLTPLRFLNANAEHLAHIAKVTDKLKAARTADDRVQLKAWQETMNALRRISVAAEARIQAKTKE
ncbi:MAG: hypothetical protein WCL32_15070 [Planctomycetota bacterium]